MAVLNGDCTEWSVMASVTVAVVEVMLFIKKVRFSIPFSLLLC